MHTNCGVVASINNLFSQIENARLHAAARLMHAQYVGYRWSVLCAYNAHGNKSENPNETNRNINYEIYINVANNLWQTKSNSGKCMCVACMQSLEISPKCKMYRCQNWWKSSRFGILNRLTSLSEQHISPTMWKRNGTKRNLTKWKWKSLLYLIINGDANNFNYVPLGYIEFASEVANCGSF